ncbi:MAG: hypothetical protein Kow0037_19700 [Calditrichia bacterium]
MFSGMEQTMNLDEVFNNFREDDHSDSDLDIIVEKYLTMVQQLRNELGSLKEELDHQKKMHGEISDSLDEFFTIQRLSSIITKSLEYEKIFQDLDEIAQRVIPHTAGEVFLLEDGEWRSLNKVPNPDMLLILNNMREEGILDWLWEQNHPIVIPVADFMVFDELENSHGNIVIAPLMRNQEGMGVYLLHTEKDQAQFSFRDLELLNILTQQAAIAMEYTRLYRRLEKAHEALKQSQSRLMQTIKMATVGELAGGIAHEINNPLQIILGNVQMALMGYKTEKSLKVVEEQAMRIANIVRGLLSMARQKTVSASEFLEVNPLIMNTINLVRGQIEKRGIEIVTNFQEKLPIIQGSSIQFQQILLNFLLNAKNQIGRNGKIEISTTLENENTIRLEIVDSGQPLTEDYIQKIIDPFGSLDGSTEMNLGLTVSIQMVRDLSGDVSIESRQDAGNKITILLPRKIKHEGQNEADAIMAG